MEYKADVVLTAPDGSTKTLVLTLAEPDPGPIPPEPPLENAIDFTADFSCLEPDHNICSAEEWNTIFAGAIDQGLTVHCLEQNTDCEVNEFTIRQDDEKGACLEALMPAGSYGMGHRSVNCTLGPVNGAVNVSFDFMVPDPGCNLWVNGGGKWGGAIQYGPIQSGETGGLRFMMTWAGGASTLGQQDLTCSIQNQPDGKQFLQPPYYGCEPIKYDHWYKIHYRMEGGQPGSPGSVLCEYWKDDDPVMSYRADTDNYNAVEGSASVTAELCCFFGGTEPNAAPADARFRFANYRVWVE